MLKRTTSADHQFQKLVVQLDMELWHRYGEEQEKFQAHNILDNQAQVVVAVVDEVPVACGCFRPTLKPGVAEIKRMFTITMVRGRGFGALVLTELERWAQEQGYRKAILETGIYQPDAVALYTKAGYSVTENYGPYVGSSYSICMEKVLK